MRRSRINRETNETSVEIDLALDGSGRVQAATGLGFLDHMLTLLAHHGRLDLSVVAKGDLEIDPHHLIEDVGLVLGQTLKEALGSKEGITRYGSAMIPMDEVLVAVVVDLGGRFSFSSDYQPRSELVGDFPTEMVNHFFKSLASESRMNLHIKMLDPGESEHHRIEGIFKAFARAIRGAVRLDPELGNSLPSTKGAL
jgi:imidazoleglycerol phosphate dehydratase HisB